MPIVLCVYKKDQKKKTTLFQTSIQVKVDLYTTQCMKIKMEN